MSSLRFETMNLTSLITSRTTAPRCASLVAQKTSMERLEGKILDIESVALPYIYALPSQVNILIQSHISRERVNSFSLISDLHYVVQNATRIARDA